MPCVSPLLVGNVGSAPSVVGCGHCLPCLHAYQDAWIQRLSEEKKQWRGLDGESYPVLFVTLTYHDSYLPKKYLVLHTNGYEITDYKPNCTVYHFGYNIRNSGSWTKHRRKLLDLYRTTYDSLAYSFDTDDLPCTDSVTRFYSHEYSTLPSPYYEYDFRPVEDHFKGSEVLAFSFPTFDKKGIQDWLKRGRKRFHELHSAWEFNPRQKPTYVNRDKQVMPYPKSYYTQTFKYWITSEYGPQTYRPHYHMMFFGMTKEEFMQCLGNEWIELNDGWNKSVDCQICVGGAAAYIAKYCAKGIYDAPYCSLDYSVNGCEYHTTFPILSEKDFNVHGFLQDKPFHLISKGLGISYAYNAQIECLYRIRHILDSQGRYSVTDYDVSSSVPNIPFEWLFSSNKHKVVYVDDDVTYIDFVRPNGSIYASSIFVTNDLPCVDSDSEDYFANLKYYRSYVTCDSATQAYSAKTYSIPLPRFWSYHLFSPYSQYSKQASLLRQYGLSRQLEVYQQKYGRSIFNGQIVSDSIPTDNNQEVVRKDSYKKVRLSAFHFLANSKLERKLDLYE